jgi:hypothetical protein
MNWIVGSAHNLSWVFVEDNSEIYSGSCGMIYLCRPCRANCLERNKY